MAKVIFIKDFDYKPTPAATVAYKAGPRVMTVRRECAEQAVAAGSAEWVNPPAAETDEANG